MNPQPNRINPTTSTQPDTFETAYQIIDAENRPARKIAPTTDEVATQSTKTSDRKNTTKFVAKSTRRNAITSQIRRHRIRLNMKHRNRKTVTPSLITPNTEKKHQLRLNFRFSRLHEMLDSDIFSPHNLRLLVESNFIRKIPTQKLRDHVYRFPREARKESREKKSSRKKAFKK